MSDVLTLLPGFEDIARDIPSSTSPDIQGVWDELIRLISGAVGVIVDGAINPVKTTLTGIYTDIKNNVTNTVEAVKTAIAGSVSTIQTAVKDEVAKVVKDVKTVVDGITDQIDTVLGGIGDAFKEAIGWIKDKLEDVVNSIKGIASSISTSISNALREISGQIKTAILDALDGIGEFLGGIIVEVREWIGDAITGIKEAIGNVIESFKETVGNVYDNIRETITSVIESLKDTYTRTKQTVEDIFTNMLDWLRGVYDTVKAWWESTLNKVANFLEKDVFPKFNDMVAGAKRVVDLAGEIWELLSSGNYQGAFDKLDGFAKGLGIPAPVATLHAILSTIAYFWESIQLQFVPLQISAAKHANINLALDPIALDVMGQGVYKGIATEKQYLYNASLGGVSGSLAKTALEASRPLPTPGAIQEGYLRGELNEVEHDQLLKGYGYTEDNLDLFKALYQLIPPPTDLIRMAVRETFTPDIASKFGQYEDFPDAFAEWASKQGINEDWAKRYWAAHWDLPSPTMGFEMLHRRIIDEDELKLLLRALDVMPYWRERLIQLSYNPITRVDLRRMYKTGVISEEDVYNGYLDIGYSEANARRLTEFTKRYSAPEDASEADSFRELARGTYSQAYKRKIISRDEYYTFLVNMGYYPDDVALLVQLDDFAILEKDKLFDIVDYRKDMLKLALSAYDRGLIHDTDIRTCLYDLGYEEAEVTLELSLLEYNRQLKLRDLLIDRLHSQYVDYIIDLTQLHTILDMYNYSSEEIDKLIEEWEIEKAYRVKRPSLTDIRRFFNQGLLSLEEFLNELRGQGYNEKYVKLYELSLQKG